MEKIHFELYNVNECGISWVKNFLDPFIRLTVIKLDFVKYEIQDSINY